MRYKIIQDQVKKIGEAYAIAYVTLFNKTSVLIIKMFKCVHLNSKV